MDQQPEQQPKAAPAQETQVAKKSGPNKGLIFGLIGGFVALILIIVAIFVVIKVNSVSATDYRDASNAVNDVTKDYNQLESVYSTGLPTESVAKSNAEKLNGYLGNYNSDMKKLNDMKAVQKDKDVKAKYDALAKKSGKLNEYYKTEIEYLNVIVPTARGIDDISASSSFSERLSKFKTIKGQLDSADVKQSINKTYVSDLSDAMGAVISAAQDLGSNPSSSDISAFYSATDKLTAADDTNRSQMNDLKDSSDIYSDASSMRSLIQDKIGDKI